MDRIAEFEVEGKRFFIYSKLHGESAINPSDGALLQVAGEILINEKKHVILTAAGATHGTTASNAVKRFNTLTKRELQIVIMVAQGLVNKVIADKLHISEWTVSTHMRRIFAKLHVDSRAEMVYQCAKLIAMHSESH